MTLPDDGKRLLSIIAESVRANLKSAELGIEDISQVLRADGCTAHVELMAEAWKAVRAAQRAFIEGMEKSGHEQAGLLHDALPEHMKESEVT